MPRNNDGAIRKLRMLIDVMLAAVAQLPALAPEPGNYLRPACLRPRHMRKYMRNRSRVLAMAAHRAQEIENKDKANPSQQGKVGRLTGNRAAYAHHRLRRDRPDIHARVLAGELSPHAGMIEAGFRKKTGRRKLTLLDRVQKLLPKLTATELRQLRLDLNRMLDGEET